MLKALFIAGLLATSSLVPGTALAQRSASELAEAIESREEMLAYTIGVQAVVYGQPVVDYSRLMRVETSETEAGIRGYAPANSFYNYGKLIEPGRPHARAPNHDTLYFRAWVDLRASPLVIKSPDTEDRYYNLDYVDFYSETQAHTGRRVTGTDAQTALLVGPNWEGETPEGMHLVRLPTHQGIVFGRILVHGAEDFKKANALVNQFTMAPLNPDAAATPLVLGDEAALDNLEFFTVLNRFLRDNPRIAGEEALMAQFDRIGVGPSNEFSVEKLSAGQRRGLERAVRDGRQLVKLGRLNNTQGWSSTRQPIGVYGRDYLSRASVEYGGLLGNMPEESVYPNIRNDMNGDPLIGSKRYRIVLPKDMPVDAFWSLSAYNTDTFDLMTNEIDRYAVNDRTPNLVRGKDGTVTIEIASSKPKSKSVNWLPVTPDQSFFLILRLYQPQPVVFEEDFTLPPIEVLP